MAVSLRSSSLLLPLPHVLPLLLLLLMTLLLPTSPDRTGVGRGRSAEYYQRRYTGRPRRGPLPVATPASESAPASDAERSVRQGHDETQWGGAPPEALQLAWNVSNIGSALSSTMVGEAEASTPQKSQLGAQEASPKTQERTDNTRDTQQLAAAAAKNRSTKTSSGVPVTRNPLDNDWGAQNDSARQADSGDPTDSASGTARSSPNADSSSTVDRVGTNAEIDTNSRWPQHKFIRLPVLTLLRFSNDACGSEAGGGWGTCLLPSECSQQGGTPARSCAHGFGVCCVLTETCGGETSANNTYFVNPEYPADGRAVRSCVFTVHKTAPEVTQIRLDLAEFRMAGPTRGTCKRDVFSVSGQDINSLVPPLCGRNDGQHLYLEVGERTGPVQLRVVTSSAAHHRWRVRISQLPGTAADRAPPLCLQYHTGRTGRISSFNYHLPVQTGQAAQTGDGGYTNNLNYMICIRKESGFCSITYSTDNFGLQVMANEFNIVNFEDDSTGGSGVPTVPVGQAGVGPIKFRHDYLVLSVDRLCGDRLNDAAASSTLTDNADVTDRSAGQFAVRFVSDQHRTGKGFRLGFRQNPCTSQ